MVFQTCDYFGGKCCFNTLYTALFLNVAAIAQTKADLALRKIAFLSNLFFTHFLFLVDLELISEQHLRSSLIILGLSGVPGLKPFFPSFKPFPIFNEDEML